MYVYDCVPTKNTSYIWISYIAFTISVECFDNFNGCQLLHVVMYIVSMLFIYMIALFDVSI